MAEANAVGAAQPPVSFTLVQHLSRPIGVVWDRYVDPDVMKDWMELWAVSVLSGSIDRAGSRLVLVFFGPWRFKSEVVRSEPPTLHEMAGRGPLGLSYRWTTRLSEREDGTQMQLDVEFGLPSGILGRLARRTLPKGDIAPRDIRRHFARFARIIESS